MISVPGQRETTCPQLQKLVERLFPPAPPYPMRRVDVADEEEVTLDQLAHAIGEVEYSAAVSILDTKVIAAIFNELRKHRYRQPEQARELAATMSDFVARNWVHYRDHFVQLVLKNPYSTDLFEVLPGLRNEPELLSELNTRIACDEHLSATEVTRLLGNIYVESLPSLRALVVALMRRRAGRSGDSWDEPLIILFANAGTNMGWTSWLVLVSILVGAPQLTAATRMDANSIDRKTLSEELAIAYTDLKARAVANPTVRELALRLRDLLHFENGYGASSILDRAAETREAYLKTLSETCGRDADLRRAAIEVLLWLPKDRAVDFAQYAATRLAHVSDKEFLDQLSSHPDRLVGYSANAVRRAAFGGRLASDLSMPRAFGSLAESLADIGLNFQITDEPARTWLGDRIVERLIEKTVGAVEARFAKEYPDHSEEGEEKLLAMMFEALSSSFAALDLSLEAVARAASAERRASVTMRYRSVDKAEEGAAGIKGSKRFSADLCLIVDPILDGHSLGRRVTLVQAKRLYPKKPLRAPPRWHHSFQLKATQMLELMTQTESSVFFFQGPVLGGRGVPVIPTRLVHDLASHQGGTGTRLARDMVAVASRSLADWFTYDLLALRIGDPLQALCAKAEGMPGSIPRSLLSVPRVEIEVRLDERSEGRR